MNKGANPLGLRHPQAAFHADVVHSGTLGAFVLSLLVAPALGEADALELVSAWGGDAYAVYAGPAIAFKTRCQVENQTLVAGCDDPGTNFMVKGTDVSGILGAGLGLGPIAVDVQYDQSFVDITSDSSQNVKNKTWTVRLAFGL